MTGIIKKIEKFATARNVIIAGLANCSAIIIMVIFFLPRLQSYSSSSILDLTFNYTPEYAYNLLTSLGSEGRNFYIISEYLDFIYLIIYSVFFTLLTAYLLKKAGFSGKPVFNLVLSVPAVGFLDIIENLFFLNMLFSFPEKNDAFINAANIATMAKWILFISILAAIILLILLITYNRFRKN